MGGERKGRELSKERSREESLNVREGEGSGGEEREVLSWEREDSVLRGRGRKRKSNRGGAE